MASVPIHRIALCVAPPLDPSARPALKFSLEVIHRQSFGMWTTFGANGMRTHHLSAFARALIRRGIPDHLHRVVDSTRRSRQVTSLIAPRTELSVDFEAAL